MRLRRSLLTALVFALAATTSANAATKPKPKPITYCNLIKDGTGDGRSNNVSLVTSPALDIQSGDIATGKSELVAVLRVGSTNTSGDNWVTLGGYGWIVGATAGGTSYTFTMTRRSMFNGGGDHPTATIGGNAVDIASFKVTANSFEWHIKRSLLTALNKKAGQVFSSFHAESQFQSSTADTADTNVNAKYPDRGLSCVKAL